MNNLLSNSSIKKVLIYFQREKDNETSNFVYTDNWEKKMP